MYFGIKNYLESTRNHTVKYAIGGEAYEKPKKMFLCVGSTTDGGPIPDP